MSETLYIQINRNIQVDKREITIGDVAALLCKNAGITARVKTIKLITLPDVPKRRVSFSVMTVMEKIEKIYPDLQLVSIGETAYTNFSGKRARQVTKQDYQYYDYLLCADSNNIRNTLRITGPDKEGKVKLLLDFTDRPGRSIADPWYTGNFKETYRDVYEGCTALLEKLGF